MNSPVGLDSLFKEKIFRIPDYQRGYAWKEPQLIDFWEDLINLQSDRFHYTGVITLKEIIAEEISEDSKEYWLVEDHSYKLYHVVDGQQRLITSIIIIQCIVELLHSQPENKEKNPNEIFLTDSLSLQSINEKYIFKQKPSGDQFLTYKFGYAVDNPSYDYMRYKIFNEPDAGNIDETFYTLNLKYAKMFFLGQLENYHAEQGWKGIRELYKKVTKNFLFNEFIINVEIDIFVAYETMNNRGKTLSKLELLKNRLIYLTVLYPDNELDKASRKNLRDDINEAWKEIYYQLGRKARRPLNDDDFLKAHWIMYFVYSRNKGNDYINFLLDDHFTPKNIHKKILKDVVIEPPEEVITSFDIDEELENDKEDTILIPISTLEPQTIRKYINSLKASAVHWFNSHNPYMATALELSDDEKTWIDKLNRIGMGYYTCIMKSIRL